MKSRRQLFAVLGLSAIVGITAGLVRPTLQDQPVPVKIGDEAPAFTLNDVDGKSHSLADYKGKLVVLQWMAPGCPVCRRVVEGGIEKTMLEQLRELDKDIVVLGVSSTHNLDAAGFKAYLEKNETEVVGVMDQDGSVGRLFGAKTTPHLFVIDKEGKLRYNGAIDNDPQGSKSDRTNYVVNAVKQIIAGDTVTPDTTKAYGCGVKYARK